MTRYTDRELIELTRQLVSIESTPGKLEENQRAIDLIVGMIKRSGKPITIEYFKSHGVPSMLAYLDDTRPERFDIVLNGHLDVVTAHKKLFTMVEKDGKLYGRGVHDEKAADIILTEAFCEFVDKAPYKLALQMVCDEESGSIDGTEYQVKQGVRSKFTLFGECGRQLHAYEIANEAKGAVFVDVHFNGVATHGAYPWRGENAAAKAAKFVEEIHKLYPQPTEEYHGSTITTVGIVSHTGARNRVPDHATVHLDARGVPNDPIFKNEGTFTAFLKKIDPSAEVKFALFAAPVYSDPNDTYLQELKKAADTIESQDFRFVRRHGGSDARHFIDTGGQACEFGVAGEHQHGPDEHITIESFKNYRATIHLFLKNIAALKTSQVKAQVKELSIAR